MRRFTPFAALLLVGCATAPAEPLMHGETPGRTCDASGSESFIGQPATADSGAAIMRVSHAAVLRWAPPGVMLTMDYRADRVTIRLGPDRKITAINCG